MCVQELCNLDGRERKDVKKSALTLEMTRILVYFAKKIVAFFAFKTYVCVGRVHAMSAVVPAS